MPEQRLAFLETSFEINVVLAICVDRSLKSIFYAGSYALNDYRYILKDVPNAMKNRKVLNYFFPSLVIHIATTTKLS